MPIFVFDTVRHNATASTELKRSQNKSVKLFFRLYSGQRVNRSRHESAITLPHPANFECDRSRVHSAAADVRNGRERRASQLLPHKTANFRLPVGNLTLPTLQGELQSSIARGAQYIVVVPYTM